VNSTEIARAIFDIPTFEPCPVEYPLDFDGMRSDLMDDIIAGLGVPPSVYRGESLPAHPPEAAPPGQQGTSLVYPPVPCNPL
jgi:hypothetical protein